MYAKPADAVTRLVKARLETEMAYVDGEGYACVLLDAHEGGGGFPRLIGAEVCERVMCGRARR